MVSPLVQTLPYVLWVLLVALAFGSFVFAATMRAFSDATTGYLRFTTAAAAVLGLLALGVNVGPEMSSDLAIRNASSDVFTSLRSIALAGFVVVAFAYAALLRLQLGTALLALGGTLSALLVLAVTAITWAPTEADAVPLFIQLAVLSLVTGGSMAAIVLGHWYLVTPKISERPLILQCRLLLGLLILQALLFVTWTTLGGGPGQTSFSAFTTGPVLLVVLRLLITIVFPIVLAWMAWRTAQTRSMESATGLLYINLAAVMAGTIGAAALYVSSGILV